MSKNTEAMTQVENVGQGRDLGRRDAEQLERGPTLTPAVDIFENDDQVLLFADLPGVKPDALNVVLDEDSLTVEARRPWKTPDGQETWFTYRRSFVVSPHIDANKVSARLENGVLRLELPKHEAVRRRRIPVS